MDGLGMRSVVMLPNKNGFVVLDKGIAWRSFFAQEIQRHIMSARKEFGEMADWYDCWVNIPNEHWFIQVAEDAKHRLEKATKCTRIIFYYDVPLDAKNGAGAAITYELDEVFGKSIQVFLVKNKNPEEQKKVKDRAISRGITGRIFLQEFDS
jgi:hypothetical protein